jgi:hypothetical protein
MDFPWDFYTVFFPKKHNQSIEWFMAEKRATYQK